MKKKDYNTIGKFVAPNQQVTEVRTFGKIDSPRSPFWLRIASMSTFDGGALF